MNPRSALFAVLLGCTLPCSADVLISQYYEGTSNNKWIELSNTDAAAVSLSGFVLTSWNNANTENWKLDGGSPDNAEDLSARSIPGNGFLLIGNDRAVLPGYATADLTSTTTFFNGDDSVVLYDTSLGAVGSTAAIADALAFTVDGDEGGENSFYRLNNGVGFDFNFGSSILEFSSVWGKLDDQADVDNAAPTDPWYLHNFASTATESLSVTLNPESVAEDAGAGVVDVTVTRTGPTGDALPITLASSDTTEAAIPLPNREIPAGQAAATFVMAIDAVDDVIEDGPQTVTITASGTGLSSGSAELEVADDGDLSPIAINEILADPASGADANGDGDPDTSDDEFVEIVNKSGADLDIGGWELHDGEEVRHFFIPGTVIPADCAIVVFSGGTVDNLGGSAIYQVANTPRLELNNTGDTVTVFDESGVPKASVTYGAEGGNNESLTRDPDITGAFTGHTGATGAGGAPFSPGTRVDGTEFCPGDGVLTISLSASSMNENGGTLTATIRRTGDLSAALDVRLTIDDATEAEVEGNQEIVTIPVTESSLEVTINAVDDVAPDGTQAVILRAIAPRYATATAGFDVEDDGDGPFNAILINEFLSDPPVPGGDANRDGNLDTSEDEFVELLNVSGAPFDLSGYELYDGFGLRHVFPAGTVLVDGRAVVVFGGGAPNGSFGGSVVQTASTGALGLNNAGDTITLRTPGGGSDLVQVSYDGTILDESMTRDPDILGSFVAHSGANGAGGALFSPGTQVDGSDFPGGIAPGSIRIVLFEIDFGTEEITINVAGLQPIVNYSFDVSLDLNQNDPWFGLQNFTTADGVEVAPGIFQFVLFDSFLNREESQYYRVRQP